MAQFINYNDFENVRLTSGGTGISITHADEMMIITTEKTPGKELKQYEHYHNEYEFILPQLSMPFIMINGAVYFGEVGWVLPITGGCEHGIKYDISGISYNDIIIRKNYFEALMKEKGKNPPLSVTPFKADEELKIYIEAFKKEFSKAEYCDRHKLRHLTALICDQLIDGATNAQIPEKREKSGYQRGIRSAAEFLNDNYDKPVSLDEVAIMCGFSRNYFTTSFRKMFGDTPLVYLTKLRVSKAALLLKTTNEPINEISVKCGYNKQNTFTQAFKTVFGKTPSQYRTAVE